MMSVNSLFLEANKFFVKKNFIEGLNIYKKIWLKYPKNLRLYEEIKKKINKYKEPINQTFSSEDIESFFKLENTGKILSVIEILEKHLHKNQNDVLTISLLGNFYGLNKNYEKSILFHKLSVEKAPFEISFYLNLSESLRKVNKLEDSLSILIFAKLLSHTDVSIDYKIAKLHTLLKNFSKSDLIYKSLIKIKNINIRIIYSYCSNLIKLNKEDEAIKFIEEYELSNQTNDIFKSILGLAYFKKKDFRRAQSFFLEAIQINNNNDNAYNMLGDCYVVFNQLNEAKRNYKKSLEIIPHNKMALNNLAALSFFKGDIIEAEKVFSLSVKMNENNHDAKYYLAQCQLAQYKYESGWANFESRWFANQFNSKKLHSNLPKFKLNTGKKNLLLWCEQGIGDQILFLRFILDLHDYIDNLFIDIDKRLHPIIKRLYPQINFVDKITNYSDYKINCQLPLGDLGSLFVKNNSYFNKNKSSYLTPEIDLRNKIKSNINNKEKLVCGLSWTSKNDDIGVNKSIVLETLEPALLNEIVFIDLQYNDTSREREKFYNDKGVKINKIEIIDNFNDLNGLISLIDLCDFVITVSNTNAHLSGALGKETFLLLPKGKGKLWYWCSKKNKSLWYESIQIIEQEKIGVWENSIIKLKKILKEKIHDTIS